jgi:acetyl esterase/lipase
MDLRGHGESRSDRMDWSKMDDRMHEATWSLAIRDVQAAAAFLREKREIHSSNLSLIGIEAGGVLAVRQALNDDTVRAVVIVAPSSKTFGFNLKEGLGELAGLQTLIASSNDTRAEASEFVNAAHQASEGSPYVELIVTKAAPADVLSDSSLRSNLTKWLRDHVMTKKR